MVVLPHARFSWPHQHRCHPPAYPLTWKFGRRLGVKPNGKMKRDNVGKHSAPKFFQDQGSLACRVKPSIPSKARLFLSDNLSLNTWLMDDVILGGFVLSRIRVPNNYLAAEVQRCAEVCRCKVRSACPNREVITKDHVNECFHAFETPYSSTVHSPQSTVYNELIYSWSLEAADNHTASSPSIRLLLPGSFLFGVRGYLYRLGQETSPPALG